MYFSIFGFSKFIGQYLQYQRNLSSGIGDWMFYHKSFGLLTGILVVPRVAIASEIENSPSLDEKIGIALCLGRFLSDCSDPSKVDERR